MVRPGSTPLRGAARALSFVVVSGGVLLVASCVDEGPSYRDYSDCDEVIRRCRTVCDYWCDAWGCYPLCFDQCWDDCYIHREPVPPPAPPAGDAAAPPPATSDGGVSDGGATADGGGSGALCAACTSNADCASGALCIVRGGPSPDASAPDGGAPPGQGFCGQACSAAADCPDGFACSQLGSVRQCLPLAGKCE